MIYISIHYVLLTNREVLRSQIDVDMLTVYIQLWNTELTKELSKWISHILWTIMTIGPSYDPQKSKDQNVNICFFMLYRIFFIKKWSHDFCINTFVVAFVSVISDFNLKSIYYWSGYFVLKGQGPLKVKSKM